MPDKKIPLEEVPIISGNWSEARVPLSELPILNGCWSEYAELEKPATPAPADTSTDKS